MLIDAFLTMCVALELADPGFPSVGVVLRRPKTTDTKEVTCSCG
jgi:hypothetical protein